MVLREHLLKHGLSELDGTRSLPHLEGEISTRLLEEKEGPEAWFNVTVDVHTGTPEEIRTEILEYAYDLFELLYDSQVDLNSFVLSFHIRIDGDKSRNIFFRTNRNELEHILGDEAKASDNLLRLENKLFDPLFRP